MTPEMTSLFKDPTGVCPRGQEIPRGPEATDKDEIDFPGLWDRSFAAHSCDDP